MYKTRIVIAHKFKLYIKTFFLMNLALIFVEYKRSKYTVINVQGDCYCIYCE